jgi:hypothetical protein
MRGFAGSCRFVNAGMKPTPIWWQQSVQEGLDRPRIACEVNDGVSRQQREPTSVRGLAATPGIPLLQVGEDGKGPRLSIPPGWTCTAEGYVRNR